MIESFNSTKNFSGTRPVSAPPLKGKDNSPGSPVNQRTAEPEVSAPAKKNVKSMSEMRDKEPTSSNRSISQVVTDVQGDMAQKITGGKIPYNRLTPEAEETTNPEVHKKKKRRGKEEIKRSDNSNKFKINKSKENLSKAKSKLEELKEKLAKGELSKEEASAMGASAMSCCASLPEIERDKLNEVKDRLQEINYEIEDKENRVVSGEDVTKEVDEGSELRERILWVKNDLLPYLETDTSAWDGEIDMALTELNNYVYDKSPDNLANARHIVGRVINDVQRVIDEG